MIIEIVGFGILCFALYESVNACKPLPPKIEIEIEEEEIPPPPYSD